MSEEKNIPGKGSKEQITSSNGNNLEEESAQHFPGDKGMPRQPHPDSYRDSNIEHQTENMEVHHHGHVHHQKKWKEYLFQFFMLFLAVFCGFLAENQREHFIEHQREKKFIRSLVQDLKADTNRLQTYITMRAQKKIYMDSLTHLLNSEMHKQMGNETYYYARQVFNAAPFVSTDGTLQQLKNAGNLRLINKTEVVDSILAYDADVKYLYEWDGVDTRIRTTFREVGGSVFSAADFYTTIDTALNFVKPSHNPQLITSDHVAINNVSFQVQYLAALTLGNTLRAKKLKERATNLLALIKKKYRQE
jgi:hypothetical protein